MHMRMDISPFCENLYECSCGQQHVLKSYSRILYQGFYRIVIECPDDPAYLTCVKIRMILMAKFIGLTSISGTKVSTDTDKFLLANLMKILR